MIPDDSLELRGASFWSYACCAITFEYGEDEHHPASGLRRRSRNMKRKKKLFLLMAATCLALLPLPTIQAVIAAVTRMTLRGAGPLALTPTPQCPHLQARGRLRNKHAKEARRVPISHQ